MTREDTLRRIARYEQHAARVHQITAARQAVIDAARIYVDCDLAEAIVVGRQLFVAVRALKKLEAEHAA